MKESSEKSLSKRWLIQKLLTAVFSLLVATVFLLIVSLADYFVPIIEYSTSHYFILFLSNALAVFIATNGKFSKIILEVESRLTKGLTNLSEEVASQREATARNFSALQSTLASLPKQRQDPKTERSKEGKEPDGEPGSAEERLQALGKTIDDAEALSNRSIVIDDADTWNNRGNVRSMLGRHEDAIADFDKAIDLKTRLKTRLEPDDADAWFNRGFSKGVLGRYEAAIADFDKAIRIEPNFARALFSRGISKNNLGRYKKAIVDFGKAIDINPKFAEFWVGRGTAYALLDLDENALANFEEAARRQPDFSEAWFCCGLAKNTLGRQEAADHREKATSLYKDAIKAFDKAILYKPDYTEAWVSRSFAKFALGDEEGARADAARAIELGFKPPQ